MAQRAQAGALESDAGDKTALGRSGENTSHVEGALGLKVLRQERAWRVWGTERMHVGLGRRERGERECRGQWEGKIGLYGAWWAPAKGWYIA